MTWGTPKTDWNTSDGIGYADMNRIESNILGVRNATVRKVQGFGYLVYNNVVGYDGIVALQPGSCYSSDGFPMWQDTEFRKNLNTWALGSGNDKGGMASAVTPAAHTWYYIYVILNSSTGAIDVMFDDDPDGANIPAGTFDKKRYVGAFKTRLAGAESSFLIGLMYSIGDDTILNPNSMFTDREIEQNVASNLYQLIDLDGGSGQGFAVPDRTVTALINARSDADTAFGFVSNYGGFSTPSTLYASFPGVAFAEALCNTPDGSLDFQMVVDDRKINVAHYNTGGVASVWMAIRGFHDERLI